MKEEPGTTSFLERSRLFVGKRKSHEHQAVNDRPGKAIRWWVGLFYWDHLGGGVTAALHLPQPHCLQARIKH